MKYRTVPAHYDGEKIVLDEEVYIEMGAKLWVMILTPEDEIFYGNNPEKFKAGMDAEINRLETLR